MKKVDNTVIKVKNRRHGRKVVRWFRGQGVIIDSEYFMKSYTFSNEREGDTFIYYGVIGDRFDNWSIESVNGYGATIIELPELPESISEPHLEVIL
jgi:hypothetical protein